MAWHILNAQAAGAGGSDAGASGQRLETLQGPHAGIWVYTILQGYIGDEQDPRNATVHTDVSGSMVALVANWENGPLRKRLNRGNPGQGRGRLYIDRASYDDLGKKAALESLFKGLLGSPMEDYSALDMAESTAASFQVSANANRDPTNTRYPDEIIFDVTSFPRGGLPANWASEHRGTLVLQIPAKGPPTAASMTRVTERNDEDIRACRTNVTSDKSMWLDMEVFAPQIKPWASSGYGELCFIQWEWPEEATRALLAEGRGTPSY